MGAPAAGPGTCTQAAASTLSPYPAGPFACLPVSSSGRGTASVMISCERLRRTEGLGASPCPYLVLKVETHSDTAKPSQ